MSGSIQLIDLYPGNMTGEEVSMDDIIDDFFVFMVAGMETTAITMSTLIWLLLKHPEISQKVVAEVLINSTYLIMNISTYS